MKKFLIIASFLFLTFYAEKTYACSCVPTDPDKSLTEQVKESYKNSPYVFSAKVLSVIENPEAANKKVKLKLTKSWKGKLTKSLTIITGLDSAGCGFNFEVGKTYLIYAYRDDDKKLNTNICTRTAEITVTKDVAVLNRIKRKT